MPVSVAIDGPCGAGKSTVAKDVAVKLGALYLDTGAMYRAIGLHMMRRRIDLSDVRAIIAELPNVPLHVKHERGQQVTYLGDEDVSSAIRTPQVSAAAASVSVIPEVRAAMVELQREIARGIDIVMDGRDIGTHVLPNATVKVFLTASAQERAHRRFQELQAKGISQPYEEVLADIIERDRIDSTRTASPLRKAPDAIEIDSTDKDVRTCADAIIALVQKQSGTLEENR